MVTGATDDAIDDGYAALLEAAPDALVVVDAAGVVVLANHQAEVLFGYSREALVGQPVDVLVPGALRSAHAAHRADFARAPRTRPMGSGRQLRAVRRDGSELLAEVSLSPVTLRTGPHVIAAVRDLTQRQQMEEALLTSAITLDSIADAVVSTDRHGHIRLVNRVAEALLGWSAGEARGRPLDEVAVLIDEQTGVVRRWVSPAPTSVGARSERDGALLRARDGRVRAIADSVAPIIDPSGAVIGMVWVFRDVTEQRRLQAQVLVADRMTSVGIMAAGLAHELNNPLTSVIAHLAFVSEALERRFAMSNDESLREPLDDLAEARRGADRMRALVRDVAHFNSGGADDERLDLNHVVQSALRIVPPDLRRGVQIAGSYGEVPAVMGSESRLGQVFLNLFMNAFQAVPRAPGGSGRVSVTTGRDARGAAFVEVSDNGAGMAPEVRDRIFTAFYTTKPAGTGSGLGLAISHTIVQALGGEISVSTAVGRGSVFRVTLPAARELAGESAAARTRVLVVEDEPGVAHAVVRLLEREHQVVLVSSAEDALAALRADAAFDAILSDLKLSGMSGMDLHAALAQAAPELADAMVFMTGARNHPEVEQFFARVRNRCIEKPFNGESLRAAVRAALRRRRDA